MPKPVSLTLHLPERTFEARNYLGLQIGAAFDIMIATDMVGQATYDDPAGWFDLASSSLQPVLVQTHAARHAFAGPVRRRFVWETDDLTIAYLLLDTPTPITLLATTFDQAPPLVQEGDWVYGIAQLNLIWGDSLDIPLGQPIQVVVEDIQRLFLHPGPGFGLVQSMHTLPPEPFQPDQVWVQVRTRT